MKEIFLCIIGLCFCICNSCGYLNIQQLGYIKNILRNPNTPTSIRSKTYEILFHHYYPWLKKQIRLFKQNNVKSMNKLLANEINQYAIYGFLESIEKYTGNVSLVYYADKFVNGRMKQCLVEFGTLKPLNNYQRLIKKKTVPSTILVSFNEYWMIESMKQQRLEKEGELYQYYNYSDGAFHIKTQIEKIKNIINNSPNEMKHLFYLRYHYDTLRPIRRIKDICFIMNYSHETYRKRMKFLMLYLKYRLKIYDYSKII